MEPKLHRRVQRYGWDLAVEDYDQYFVPLLRHCSERCLEMAALQPGERVLDIATGTGVAAFVAAERVGPQGEVVATDISQRMVDAGRGGGGGVGRARPLRLGRDLPDRRCPRELGRLPAVLPARRRGRAALRLRTGGLRRLS